MVSDCNGEEIGSAKFGRAKLQGCEERVRKADTNAEEKMLAFRSPICYNSIRKGNRHRVVDLMWITKPSLSRQSTGEGFCYVSDKSNK